MTRDGDGLSLAGRELEILHTPGHALHHQVFVDRAHACIFTGDTFGLSYRELDSPQGAFIVPTTTPTQFDPEQLIASIDRLLSYSPAAMYLMHFSRVTDVPRLGESLKGQIRELTRIAEQSAAAPDRAAAIRSGHERPVAGAGRPPWLPAGAGARPRAARGRPGAQYPGTHCLARQAARLRDLPAS